MWQEWIVGIAVLAAAVYTLRRYWPAKQGTKSTGCSSCSGCAPGCASSGKAIALVKHDQAGQ
jgi:hypothetical protein